MSVQGVYLDNYQSWHPNFPVTLKNCHDEPIRIPGAIQTFGALIAFDGESNLVKAISQNAMEHFPQLKSFETEPINIQNIFDLRETSVLATQPESKSDRRFVEVLPKNSKDKIYHGVRFRATDLEVLEIELKETSAEPLKRGYLNDLPLMLKEAQSFKNSVELSKFIAKKIKEITGFDRVMIYRYDHNWNGEVIAEEKEDHLESFFGLHYPASDIPPQARALYEKNWIRIIPTVNYQPSLIVPSAFQNLDLSESVLRSVSPIHIRYLKNMGVGASMSISLIVDGKLWGLVACHHYSEHFVPLSVRLGCEAYGQLVSWQIKMLESASLLEQQVKGEKILHQVLERFSHFENFKVPAQDSTEDLLKLFDCTGIVIRLGDETVVLGENPGDKFAASVAKNLIDRNVLEPFVSDKVSKETSLDLASPVSSATAGVLALALSPHHNYYIMCVRPEERKTVNWAGNPHVKDNIDPLDPDARLQPRGSFALWAELHQGQSQRWSLETIELLKKFGLFFIKIVIERKEFVERTNSELHALNRAKDEFVATVSHELRTPLNAIIGWTDLALSGDLEEERFSEALKVIQRNARSQNQLISDLLDVSRIISGKMKLSIRNMRVTDIVEAVVLSFSPAADAKSIRVISQLDGSSDSIIGDPGRIQQVVWNILSNAVKFSPKESKIWLKVYRENSHIIFSVQDQGIGLASEDFDKIFGRFEQVDSTISRKSGGLGLGLAISKHIVELHGGRIDVASEGPGKGTTFKVIFPIAPVLPDDNSVDIPIDDLFKPTGKAADIKRVLQDEVILVVEDEVDASRFLNLLLTAHGAKTFVAFNGEEALAMLEKHGAEIGMILSDVGMPIMDGYQMIQKIRESSNKHISSMCAVALTAYGRPQDRVQALRAGFDSYITKPVMQEELIAVLETTCKSRTRRS